MKALLKKKYRFKNLLKKILNHSFFVLFITKTIQLYLLIVFITSKVKLNINEESINILKSNKVCFLSLWHGRIIIFPKIMKKFGKFKVLTSLHKDGKYVDQFVKLYNHDTIRGSSFKGGLSATKNIIKSIQQNERIVITPDGPRGPRYKVNSTLTNLAIKLDIPIICLSFAVTKSKTLKSWDNFTIPLPFTKILVNISKPYKFNEAQNNELEKIMIKQLNDLDNQISLKN